MLPPSGPSPPLCSLRRGLAMSADDPAMPLTADTVCAYVSERLGSMSGPPPLGGAGLSGREIHGGNLNYAFEVKDGAGASVFVKQATDFIKVLGKDAKLHRERLQLEVQAMEKMSAVLGERGAEFIPRLYLVDTERMVFVSEFLGSHQLLQESLFAGVASQEIAAKLGEFMGLLHSRTHSSRVACAEADKLTADYSNDVLRAIQLEYVFSKCFREDDRTAALRGDASFMEALEELKGAYRGQNRGDLALLHGDLHAGSVMADAATGGVKVIDPEFCIYGPPGLDVGSLISTYALAYCFHAATGSDRGRSLREAIEQVWSTYARTMEAGGVSGEALEGIGRDAAGFAGCEIARTACGLAYERSLKLPDAAAKAEADGQALAIGAACIAGRQRGLGALTGALERYGSYPP